MTKFFIWNIGCQMNKAESALIREHLLSHGYAPAKRLIEADLVVLNTCVVRQAAEDKVRGTLGYLKGIKRNRPDLRLLVTGCFVNSNIETLRLHFPHVDLFFKPGEYSEFIQWIKDHQIIIDNEFNIIQDSVENKGIISYIPIIKGCNNFCSYCIVPYRRGREKSIQFDDVVSKAKELVKQKTKEVILLGQNVNSYGQDLCEKTSLNDLLSSLNNIDELSRIRFLTNHPKDMNSELIQSVARLDKVCEHITLPVQSGDDTILEQMKRGYTAKRYIELVHSIRKTIPNIALSTDVIVGFPGETARQFERTLDLLQEIRFDVTHVAAYSPRPQTFAAKCYVDNVQNLEKEERLRKVECINEKIASEINYSLSGKVVEVLVEGLKGGKWYGRTRSDKLVFFESLDKCLGKLLNIKITKTSPWALQGYICQNDFSL